METVVVCQTAEGFPVHFDRHAFEADHVLVCGRVKPHTGFVGDIESGLMKMMLIGLGKHERGQDLSPRHPGLQLRPDRPQRRRRRAGEVPHPGRPGASSRTPTTRRPRSRPCAPDEFEAREKELLVLAKQWMPRLPFPQVDVLLIDEIGKNISGPGMDTNVVGRKFNDHEAAERRVPQGQADRRPRR